MAPVPDRVRRFIATSVPSVPWVEALLILRAHSGQPWDGASLAPRLYLPVARARELLDALAQAGIAVSEEPGVFRYGPPQELLPVLDALAELYTTHLVQVTKLIHGSLDRRALQFADAFRVRREEAP